MNLREGDVVIVNVKKFVVLEVDYVHTSFSGEGYCRYMVLKELQE